MTEIIIRCATLNDHQPIKQLMYELHELHACREPKIFNISPTEVFSKKDFEESLDDPKQVELLAESSGTIVGYCHISIIKRGSTSAFEFSASISSFVVSAKYQRQGIGSALMHAAERKAVEKGASYLTLGVSVANPEALGFYKSQNMQIEAYRMTKFLDSNLLTIS